MVTNDILKKALRFSGKVGTLASEEENAPINLDPRSAVYAANRGEERLHTTSFNSDVVQAEVGKHYVAVFEPLDGNKP